MTSGTDDDRTGTGPGTDVIICRCERVSLADVQRLRAAFQVTSLRELKLVTRVSMGICQGRVCRPVLEAWQRQWFPDDADWLRDRAPVRPMLLGRLATEEGSDVDR